MKTLFLAFLLSFSFTAVHAGKKYTVSFHVTSLITGQPVKGIVVYGVLDKGREVNGTTDENGNIKFTGLKAKKIEFTFADPNYNFKEYEYFLLNSKRNDQEEKIQLRYTQFKEQELVNSKKKKISSDSTAVNQDSNKFEIPIQTCDTLRTTEAEFPGGMKEMMHFLMRNVEYPQKAIEDEVSGKVYLRFIVEENGAISNIEVVRGVSPEIDEEAIRVIAYMPDWKPAKCDGVPIRSTYMFPLKFSLQ